MADANVMHVFYGNLAKDHEQAIPLPLQRRIFTVLSKGKDWESLAALALHPDLTPEIDSDLRALKAAKVRTAWVSRPGRTPKELEAALKGETRVSVLEIYANMAAAPDEWYQRALKAGSVKVADPIIKNTRAPKAVRHEAAQLWVSCANGNTGVYQVKALFDAVPELHDSFVESMARQPGKAMLLLPAARWELSMPNQAVVLAAIKATANSAIKELSGTRSTYSYQSRSRLDAALDASTQIAQSEMWDSAIYADLRAFIESVEVQMASVTSGYGPELAKKVTATLTALELGPVEGARPLRMAACSTDEAELMALASKATADQDQGLGAALLSNKAISSAVVERLLGSYTMLRLLGQDVFELHADNDEVFVRLCEAKGRSYWNAEEAVRVLSLSADPAFVTRTLLTRYIDGHGYRHIPEWMLASPFLQVEDLLGLRADSLLMTSLPDPVRRAVCDRLIELVGEEERWELFEALASDTDSSIAELIDAITVLSDSTTR